MITITVVIMPTCAFLIGFAIGFITRDFYILPTILLNNGDGLYHTLKLAWGKWYIGVCWKKAKVVEE